CCIPSLGAFYLPVFFFDHAPPTDIYTLSYTTLFRSPPQRPASPRRGPPRHQAPAARHAAECPGLRPCRHRLQTGLRSAERASATDRKSTRLNSSHVSISYAVFCLKKKNNNV